VGAEKNVNNYPMDNKYIKDIFNPFVGVNSADSKYRELNESIQLSHNIKSNRHRPVNVDFHLNECLIY